MSGAYNMFCAGAMVLVLGACGGDDDTDGPAPGTGPTAVPMDGGVRTTPPAADGGTGPSTADAGRLDLVDVDTARALGDCSRANEECFEARGFYRGKPFACPGTYGPFSYRAGDGDTNRLWVKLSDCSEGIDSVSVLIPIVKPGTFSYVMSPGPSPLPIHQAYIERVDGSGSREGVDSEDQDFTARIDGVVTPERTVRGSFSARWLDSTCKAKTADTLCDGTSFTMTFNGRIPGG